MLISAHKDGRIISKTVAPFGIRTVEGSTKKKGTEALLKNGATEPYGQNIGHYTRRPQRALVVLCRKAQ
ncbi:MAG: DUF374 domain-containing protein [Holosporaceae bacterium]|nr:MAG: DUF374 domain-containing protein [Holosporaceae bacterium]